jgi:nucleotide-binding universal stress UspA family protein
MRHALKVFFGLDDSDFSRNAVAACGRLMKNNEKASITLFHGVPESITLLSKKLNLDASDAEKWKKQSELGTQKILDQARGSLTEVGFSTDRVSVVVQEECDDPATEMVRMAESEGYETLAVGRLGAGTAGRQVLGSVTYRLCESSKRSAVWVVDSRVSSRNIMVCLVGAEASRRVVDYVVDYFGHLRECTFTLFHVVPALPPGYRRLFQSLKDEEFDLEKEAIDKGMKEYSDKVKEISGEASERLIQAGVPEQNVVLNIQTETDGIARDILSEVEEGNHGILVIGRKGSGDSREFGLGSNAYKLLCSARTFVTCLVN